MVPVCANAYAGHKKYIDNISGIILLQEGDSQDMKRKHDHEERTKRLAKRKLMR